MFRQAWTRYSDNITAMDAWVCDLLRQLEDDGLADTTLVVFWSDHGVGMPRASLTPSMEQDVPQNPLRPCRITTPNFYTPRG